MTVRHAARHIEASLLAHVQSVAKATGWTNANQALRPFRLPQVPVFSSVFDGRDPQKPADGSAPVVNVVLLGQDPDSDIEVGGSNIETVYDFAVTILARPGVSAALTEDIHDALAGRTQRPLVPFYQGATLLDEVLELEEVSSGRAQVDRPDWHVVLGSIRRGHQRAWA